MVTGSGGVLTAHLPDNSDATSLQSSIWEAPLGISGLLKKWAADRCRRKLLPVYDELRAEIENMHLQVFIILICWRKDCLLNLRYNSNMPFLRLFIIV